MILDLSKYDEIVGIFPATDLPLLMQIVKVMLEETCFLEVLISLCFYC